MPVRRSEHAGGARCPGHDPALFAPVGHCAGTARWNPGGRSRRSGCLRDANTSDIHTSNCLSPAMSDSSILDRVKSDLTDAMKAQDDVRRRALRSLRAALANKEIEQREKGADSTLGPQDELAVVQKQVKQRRDSIEQYEEAGREDLAQKERDEIDVLEAYLPEQMSDDEVAERLDAIIEEVGATSMADMGPVMGQAMNELRGRVDGNRVREMVQARLSE